MTISGGDYFLFEEIIKKILKKLIRDKNLFYEIQGIRPIIIINSTDTDESCIYPYSGIFPISGLPYQCAPFSYMSINPNEIYAVLRNFFAKYLSHLSSYTTNNNSILFLIYNFQNLLDTYLVDLKNHLAKIGFDILETVFEWISFSFSNLMGPKEVFYLYDLIIISDNMIIMVYFALGLLNHKKQNILMTSTKEEMKNILEYLKYENIEPCEILLKIKEYTDGYLFIEKKNLSASNMSNTNINHIKDNNSNII
jgi:hypothetical protein